MSESDRVALAAHLHVLMRRHLGRVTDVEWMARNREYAQEIVRIAHASPHAGLHEWAGKLAGAFAQGGTPLDTPESATPASTVAVAVPPIVAANVTPIETRAPPEARRRYVASLR